MRNPIILSGQIVGTDSDILNGTRLATAPYNGRMTFKIQASDNAAANHYVMTLALPGGDVPIDGQLVPAGNTAGLPGVIDDRTALVMTFDVQQGGQVLFSAIETGDSELSYIVRFG